MEPDLPYQWAASLKAVKTNPQGIGFVHTVMLIRRAANRAEAEQRALREARRRWPVADGWHDHGVMVSAIDESLDPDLPEEAEIRVRPTVTQKPPDEPPEVFKSFFDNRKGQ